MPRGQMLIIRSKIAVVEQFCRQNGIAYRLYPSLGIYRRGGKKQRKGPFKSRKTT